MVIALLLLLSVAVAEDADVLEVPDLDDDDSSDDVSGDAADMLVRAKSCSQRSRCSWRRRSESRRSSQS